MSSFEDTVIKLYREGHSTYKIAKDLDTYPNKVNRILRKRGESVRDKGEAQKNALEQGRAKHPTKGRKRSLEERLAISQSMVENWSGIDDEERERRSEQSRKYWMSLSQEERDNMRALATDALKTAAREGSKFENFIFDELSNNGFNVESHKKDLIYNEKLEIDLFIPDLKTIIEVDGPSHFFPVWGQEKLEKQIKADTEKSGLILSKGFVIIRVKVMKNTLSMSDQYSLLANLIDTLHSIEKSFPQKRNRYIEIEL